MVLAPGDLIDADVDQPGQAVRIQFLVGDPLTHRADGAPGDAGERGHRGLVGLGDQPHDQVLEVAGEPRPGAGETHRLGHHTMLRTAQPATAHYQHADPSAQVKMPPPGIDRPAVVPVPGLVRTRRAGHHPTAGTQPDQHRAAAGHPAQVDIGDGHAVQLQDTVE